MSEQLQIYAIYRCSHEIFKDINDNFNNIK